MKKNIFILLLAFSFNLLALDLDSARSSGKVEELADGYLKASDASAETLVQEVNAKRKAHYEEVAKKTNVPVEEVAKAAALKIKEKLGK